MIHTLSIVAVTGLAATLATAQQNPIAARKQLMKHNGDQAKIGAAMAKGDAPLDLATAHKIFAAFEDTAAKASALFQEKSVEEATVDDLIPQVRKSGKTWTTSKQDSLSLAPMRKPRTLP